MKVTVSLEEIQHFTCFKEVEMTAKEYKQYLKMGKISREIEDEVSSNGIQYHKKTEYIYSEIIE